MVLRVVGIKSREDFTMTARRDHGKYIYVYVLDLSTLSARFENSPVLNAIDDNSGNILTFAHTIVRSSKI